MMYYIPLAFSVAWAALFVYVTGLGCRQVRLDARLRELERTDDDL